MLFRSLDEALLKEAAFGVELANLTFDDSLDNVGWLVLTFHLLAVDVLFGLNEVGSDVITAESGRCGSSDVKSQVFHEVAEAVGLSRLGLFSTDFDEDAHFTTEVDVGGDGTFTGNLKTGHATKLEVFPHFKNLGFDELVERFIAFWKGECSGRAISPSSGDGVEDISDEGLEVVIFSDEVGFAVELDESAGLAGFIELSGDDTFLCFTISLLNSLGFSSLTEEFHGCFEITFGLLEGVLALHHSHAGGFTEFFNE